MLFAMMYIIIPGTVSLGAFFDRMFVNSFGLPVNSGITFYVLALLALLGWAIWFTHKKGKSSPIPFCSA